MMDGANDKTNMKCYSTFECANENILASGILDEPVDEERGSNY